MLIILLRIAAFLFGGAIVIYTFLSAVRTFVMPRASNTTLTRIVFRAMNLLFQLRLRKAATYEARDHGMALYAPLTLLVLPGVWVAAILVGYMFMYWALQPRPIYDVFSLSGSSLLTLGFTKSEGFPSLFLEFSEAGLGLIMIALLIAYLPTMYSAFSRRETMVAMLEVRAGTPPSPQELLTRAQRIRGLDVLTELWEQWEVWFVEVEESHTSLAALIFFRSPQPNLSWITAAGVILDTAALLASTVDVPNNPQAQLMLRAGYLALRRIADYFSIDYEPNPTPDDFISISQDEYNLVYDQLVEGGVPVKADREAAWRAFRGWRVNYDRVLLALAALTMAPYTQWVSDRSLPRGTMFRRGSRKNDINGVGK
ncbi:MAG: hypothetical protein ABI835_03645 [Chloroflexota bacterium]